MRPPLFLLCALAALLLAGAASAQERPVYLHSNVGDPWSSASNDTAMDTAFGGGNWDLAFFETVVVGDLLAAPRFIFMEGSDDNADEMEAFLVVNQAAINAFLMDGGVIFFNAAPNEGDGMGFPDGNGSSVQLNYANASLNPVDAVIPGHPIFNGPHLPTATSFTGSSFGHADVIGSGLVSLMQDAKGDVYLASRAIGKGSALYGGMTTVNFHGPASEAANLRANILAYGASLVPLEPVYLRSNVAAPWGSTSNETAMDAAFGAGHWTDARYETVVVADLFAKSRFVFMEGSDGNATELETFLTANQAAINSFLLAGGVIFFNAAPNEDDGMGLPDGTGLGATLTYPAFSANPVTAVDAAHPIFVGPLPTTTSFTGGSFAHAAVSGAALVPLLQDASGSPQTHLAEAAVGGGHALYGGMTTANFHSPQPESQNLRTNILVYAESLVREIDAVYLRSSVAGNPWFNLSNDTQLDRAFGPGNWTLDFFESVDVGLLLSRPRFLFLEGSDLGADDLEAFLTANQASLNTFLQGGGVAFFNAAPNEGNGMTFPGAGLPVTLTFPGFSTDPVDSVDPSHPVFAGPFPTTTTGFTGSSFAHAAVSGAGLVPLLEDSSGTPNVHLAERSLGSGLGLYGGMTTADFHGPQPEADNLRANIFVYGARHVMPEPSGPLGLLAGALVVALCARRRRA